MYFIEKVGQYGHGVFWIGEDLAEGVHELLIKCTQDNDGWHQWQLNLFSQQHNSKCDANHKVIAAITKSGLGVTTIYNETKILKTEIGNVNVIEGFYTISNNFNGQFSFVEESL